MFPRGSGTCSAKGAGAKVIDEYGGTGVGEGAKEELNCLIVAVAVLREEEKNGFNGLACWCCWFRHITQWSPATWPLHTNKIEVEISFKLYLLA